MKLERRGVIVVLQSALAGCIDLGIKRLDIHLEVVMISVFRICLSFFVIWARVGGLKIVC